MEQGEGPGRYYVSSGSLEAYVVASSPRDAAAKALRHRRAGDRLGLLMSVYSVEEDGYTVNKGPLEGWYVITEVIAEKAGISLRRVE